jgi:subfamily B ATP-binding cassette protein MsbA
MWQIKNIRFSRFLNSRHQRLVMLVKDKMGCLLLAMACMAIVAATSSATAFLVKPAIDDIFVQKNVKMLRLVPLAVIIVYLLRGLATYAHRYLMNYVGQSIIRRLRNQLYNHILDLPLAFFQREKTGVLMSRITSDVNIVKAMVSEAVTSLLRDFFTIVGLTGLIIYRDWRLAVIALLVLPVAYYPILYFGKRVRRVSTGRQEAMAEMNTFLHETIAGNKVVKAFGMEPFEKQRFHGKTWQLFRLQMKSVAAKAISTPVMECLGGIGVAAVIWYGGMKVISGQSTPGTFFSFMVAVLMLYDPVKKLSKLNNTLQEGLAAADRVYDVLDEDSDIKDTESPVVLTPGSHHVAFHHVYFKYGRNDNNDMVLKDITLDARPGQVLALVGMSGGGKSTLVNLLYRFYDVTDGCITIDGVDIREIQIESLRKQISMVTQEPILFNESIRDNIAYGNPDAGEADIEAAAGSAYALEFVQRLPDQFDTRVGELGGRLSGGEKQRICIARALLKNAPILVLDEATSALDAEAETLVQKALVNLMKGRTTFVIAHRLSTIRHADRIVVLSGGRIVEEGSHDALLSREGEYYKLYHMQFDQDENASAS